MSTDLMETVGRLGDMAKRAGELASEQSAAYDEVNQAEAELLDAVIARVKPGLRAVSSRIQSSRRSWWPDNVSTSEETDHLEERGLRVYGDGPELDHPRANRGQYEGTDLYLLRDGTWLEVAYSGSWSCWQGEGSEWTAETRVLSTTEVASEYSIPYLIDAIAKALEAQLSGKREKATKRALERAETMRALTTLLGRKS